MAKQKIQDSLVFYGTRTTRKLSTCQQITERSMESIWPVPQENTEVGEKFYDAASIAEYTEWRKGHFRNFYLHIASSVQ
jgi:hypothetical protein